MVLNPNLHIDPKCPNVEGEDGFTEPGWKLHPIQTTPGAREKSSRKGAVQRHLQEKKKNYSLTINSF